MHLFLPAFQNLLTAETILDDYDKEYYSFFGLKCNSNLLRAEIYRTLGAINRELNSEEEAEVYYAKAQEAAVRAEAELQKIPNCNELPENIIRATQLRDPMWVIAHIRYSFGYYWFDHREYEKAESLFTSSIEALEKSGEYWDAPYIRLAIVQFVQGELDRATETFRHAITVGNAISWRNWEASLGLALCALGLGVIECIKDHPVLEDDPLILLETALGTDKHSLSRSPLECHRDDARHLQSVKSEDAKKLIRKFVDRLNREISSLEESNAKQEGLL